jgi:cytidylate kinase
MAERMASVTIAATYGAGGSVIAPAVARRLGLPLVGRAIPPALAAQLDERLQAALVDDAHHVGAPTRLLTRALSSSGLVVGVPHAPEELGAVPDVARAEAMLRSLADGDGAVILGMAGVFVLKGRKDTLHVRLDGPVEARRRQAMAHEGLDYETAARLQEQNDRARRAYVEHFHPQSGAWNDIRHYHLVLDSTVISLDTCVDLIVLAAEDLANGREHG